MIDLTSEPVEIIIGGSLMFLSFFLSLLMVIRVVEPRFILSFATYSLSLIGLVLGLHGIYGLVLKRRSKEKENVQENL